MIILNKLPDNGVKVVSREALAKCLEAVFQSEAVHSSFYELVEKVRADKTFDVAVVSNSSVEDMKIEMCKYAGKEPLPLFNSYCGHAIEKIIQKLPYGFDYSFPSAIRIVSEL